MIPVISFIGWHNSGKTTLITQVVSCLKQRGYRVAVIKATKEQNIVFDSPESDTGRHRRAGADRVLLVAPDQTAMISGRTEKSLAELAHSYCRDVDIVIGEGFKGAADIPKIEVRRDSAQPLLYGQVSGVVALATDLAAPDCPGIALFGLDEGQKIADFIERYCGLAPRKMEVKESG